MFVLQGGTPALMMMPHLIMLFFGCAQLFGIMMTMPIGGADMPVVISIYNAATGLAVGLEGFVLENPRADDCRHGGRCRRPPAHPADGEGHESGP